MTHAEFIAGCRAGTLKPRIEPALAARYFSARLALPMMRLPVLGAGVALALIGWILSGLSVIAFAAILPWLVARAAPNFVLDEALASETRFSEFLANGILILED
jgi:hypothetical protein